MNNEVGWKDGLVVKSMYGLPHNLNSFPAAHRAVCNHINSSFREI